MFNLWLGNSLYNEDPLPDGQVRREDITSRSRLAQLEQEVGRLKLLNQALWELIRDRTRLADKDLEAKAQEIDLRDGKEDGQMGTHPLRCPECGRVSSSKHWRCLYCGLEFDKPSMG
jgi:hypothetical protein